MTLIRQRYFAFFTKLSHLLYMLKQIKLIRKLVLHLKPQKNYQERIVSLWLTAT